MFRLIGYFVFFYLIYIFFRSVIAPIFKGYYKPENNYSQPDSNNYSHKGKEQPDNKDDEGEYIDYTEVK